mgnify:CR=1 FL=1
MSKENEDWKSAIKAAVNEDWKSKTKNKLKRWKTADKVLNDLYKMAEQNQPWLKEWIDRRFAEYLEGER